MSLPTPQAVEEAKALEQLRHVLEWQGTVEDRDYAEGVPMDAIRTVVNRLQSLPELWQKAEALDHLQDMCESKNTDSVIVAKHEKDWHVEPIYIKLTEQHKSFSYSGDTLAKTILLDKLTAHKLTPPTK